MIGVILAAGMASRLNRESDIDIIKPLLEVGDKELIRYSLDNLDALKLNNAIIVVNDDSGELVAKIGDAHNGVAISYALQSEPKGLINALSMAVENVDDDIVLQLSDEIFVNPYLDGAIDWYKKSECDFLITYTHEKSQDKIRGNFSVDIDSNGRIIQCIEKSQTIINDLKGTGFCVFSRECIRMLKNIYSSGENYPNNICDFINELIKLGKVGASFCIADEEININTVGELEYARLRISSEVAE